MSLFKRASTTLPSNIGSIPRQDVCLIDNTDSLPASAPATARPNSHLHQQHAALPAATRGLDTRPSAAAARHGVAAFDATDVRVDTHAILPAPHTLDIDYEAPEQVDDDETGAGRKASARGVEAGQVGEGNMKMIMAEVTLLRSKVLEQVRFSSGGGVW